MTWRQPSSVKFRHTAFESQRTITQRRWPCPTTASSQIERLKTRVGEARGHPSIGRRRRSTKAAISHWRAIRPSREFRRRASVPNPHRLFQAGRIAPRVFWDYNFSIRPAGWLSPSFLHPSASRESRVHRDSGATTNPAASAGDVSGSAGAAEDELSEMGGAGSDPVSDRGALALAHRRGIVDFANPERLGIIGFTKDGNKPKRDLDRVVGFQAHAFRSMPDVDLPSGTQWRIADLQLVSLLKHDPPAAYLSQNLPRMDELRQAATRPLDSFEFASLDRLRRGEELIVAEGSLTIRMLGAIRAARQCIECHDVTRGTLLGAFSYRLRRATEEGEPAPNEPQPPRRATRPPT